MSRKLSVAVFILLIICVYIVVFYSNNQNIKKDNLNEINKTNMENSSQLDEINKENLDEINTESLDEDEILTLQINKIVKAYKENNDELLTDFKDRYILNESKKIIANVINDNMTDLMKEKAIHDYIIINCKYDRNALNDFAEVDPDSSNPYGVLKNKKAICMGYTLTFKMFMDMLDIDCIIIHSLANGNEHAWNMVKISDKWYHVDVTWDDPLPDLADEVEYIFFNVDTEFMKSNGHVWDQTKFPKS